MRSFRSTTRPRDAVWRRIRPAITGLQWRARRNCAAFPAQIVMPSNSAKVKVRAVESYGAQIVFCEPTEEAREAACAEVIKKTGATLIHSFENEDVIAGQGTAAVELLEDIADLDLVMCPVGGGGLLSGTAVAAKSMRPTIKVIAAEPENVDDAAQSFRAGRLIQTEKKFTIADGLRTNVGAPNFALIQRYVDDIVTVSEEAIVSGHAHHLGDDEDHRRAVRSRSVCRDRRAQDRHHRQTCRHHSHRWQCRSRCVAVEPVAPPVPAAGKRA